jgi:hypothetical protein
MEQLGVDLAVEATRFAEVVGPLLDDPRHQIFHLEIPSAIEPGTPLARQVQAFLTRVDPSTWDLEVGTRPCWPRRWP